jgi:hypothetical protein
VVQRELEKHEKEQEELKVKRKEYGVTKEEREGREDAFAALPGMSPRRRSERALRQIREMNKSIDEEEDDDLEVIIENKEGLSTTLDQKIFMQETPQIQGLSVEQASG